jgi:hypothetical protein
MFAPAYMGRKRCLSNVFPPCFDDSWMPHISLVFREIGDSAALSLRLGSLIGFLSGGIKSVKMGVRLVKKRKSRHFVVGLGLFPAPKRPLPSLGGHFRLSVWNIG